MFKLARFQVTGIVALTLFGLIFLAVTLSNTIALAQTVCGTITNLQGTSNPYTDCQNPFGAESFFPFAVDISGVTLADNSEYELPLDESLNITYGETDVYQFINLALYKQDDTDFVAVPLLVIGDQSSVIFDEAGVYTIVIRGEELVTQAPGTTWLAKLKGFFFNQVYAQTEEEEDGQLFVLNFTVLEEELPPAPCGVIFNIFGEPTPVADCDNPFGLPHPNLDLTVTFAETLIEPTGQYDFLGATSTFNADIGESDANSVVKILYRHSGEDFITEYHTVGSYIFTATGTYSLVIEEEELIPTFRSMEKWRSLIIPTAFAASGDRTIITFEVIGAPPEPPGPSSVLFLPGIQASRLYLGDGTQVSDKLWEPSFIGGNDDVMGLALDENGESSADIRTQDIIDEVALPVIGGNIYKDFINFLNGLVDDEVINDWTPFAYDWRYDVFDIVDNGTHYRDGTVAGVTRYPIAEIEQLAATSKSGKVTIIGHSNGGLLAKAIMRRLEAQGKTNLIDQIIFIGTPHLGTPKALATILHGYDQEKLGGYVIDDSVAREVISNLPGAYSLLPSATYFDNLGQPMVTFDNSVTTASFRNAYGPEVNSVEEFSDFMVGNEDLEHRTDVAFEAVNEPIGGNAVMLDGALAAHANELDNWTPPPGVGVHEIVGTGLITLKGLEYREIEETVCDANVTPITCTKVKLLKPYARLTKYGDETVVSTSAEGAEGAKSSYYLNIFQANSGLGINHSHASFTETPEIQELLEKLLTKTEPGDINFVTAIEPSFSEAYSIESLDSPVNLYATDEDGYVTGLVEEGGELILKKEIPGSEYLSFGDTKYLIIPKNTNHTTSLIGEALGGYTLTIAELNNSDEQTIIHQINNATSTLNMVAKFEKDNNGYNNVTIDFDGDGEVDEEMTIDGELINPPEPVVTYDTLKTAIEALNLKPIYKTILLKGAQLAEYYSIKAETNPTYEKYEIKSLDGLTLLIKAYMKKKLITVADGEHLLDLINQLKN